MKISNIVNRRNRILLRELVVTDFKLRYQGSALGYLWSVLKPLFLFAILYVVFDRFLKFGRDIEHYPVYLLTGVVLWSFFTEATSQGLNAIVKRGSLIRKINFPKYIIVISGTVSSLINLGINLGVVFVFILFNGVSIGIPALLIIPLIIELYVFALAIAFFLAAVNVKYRDMGYLWEVFLQAAFYATPIIYPVQLIISESQFATSVILSSPVAQVIQDTRYWLITEDSIRSVDVLKGGMILIPYIIVLLLAVMATIYFKRNQKNFAELV